MKKPNTVLLIVDALRYDRINPQDSPFMMELFNKGYGFTNYFAVSNATETCMATMFTGEQPFKHNLVQGSSRRSFRKLFWLPKHLQTMGYKTYFYDWLLKYYKIGINKYIETYGGEHVSWLMAKEVIEKVLETKLKEPYFAIIHLWDTHSPYAARGYDDSVLYVDNCIRVLQHELDPDIMIITADHGESLGEHGIMRDHHGLYDTTLHIPLILWKKGIIDSYNPQVDVLSSELDFSDIVLNFINHNQIPRFSRPAVFAWEYSMQDAVAVRTDRFKYIEYISLGCKRCKKWHGQKRQLYDIQSDPYETMNLLNYKKRPLDLQRSMAAKLAPFKYRYNGTRWVKVK